MNESLKAAWKFFLELKAESDKLKAKSDKVKDDAIKLLVKARKLKAKSDKVKVKVKDDAIKLLVKVRKLKAKGNKLLDESDELLAESDEERSSGDQMWERTIIQFYGNGPGIALVFANVNVYSNVHINVPIEWTEKGCKVNGVEYLY